MTDFITTILRITPTCVGNTKHNTKNGFSS